MAPGKMALLTSATRVFTHDANTVKSIRLFDHLFLRYTKSAPTIR